MGEPIHNCLKALELLGQGEGLAVGRKSSLYKTEPIGYSTQPWFINAVVEAESALDPWKTLERLHTIENSLGRTRGVRWGSRSLDLDLLFYGNRILEGPGLVIPHPRIQERRFVLLPLAEIAPDWRHPILAKSVRELLEGLEA
ncbi:MAG: 2-amino-4-hydroxy-6-hydroxymethyldihydropteridine diphosphokinase, partial [Candidatus Binatia bacterium]